MIFYLLIIIFFLFKRNNQVNELRSSYMIICLVAFSEGRLYNLNEKNRPKKEKNIKMQKFK
jgi:hypothetical protein